jgi:hypothetical protein
LVAFLSQVARNENPGREALSFGGRVIAQELLSCCHCATKSGVRADIRLLRIAEEAIMVDQISPKFHAEIIVVLFDEYRDLRKVTERVSVLLSNASPEHIEAVGKSLPIDLTRALPRRMFRAA